MLKTAAWMVQGQAAAPKCKSVPNCTQRPDVMVAMVPGLGSTLCLHQLMMGGHPPRRPPAC